MSNTDVRRPRVTLADICLAIADGRLKATRERDGHYAINRQELKRFVAQLGSGLVRVGEGVPSN